MSVRHNIHMSKIMHMLIKVGIHIYTTYANCWTLRNVVVKSKLCPPIGSAALSELNPNKKEPDSFLCSHFFFLN